MFLYDQTRGIITERVCCVLKSEGEFGIDSGV